MSRRTREPYEVVSLTNGRRAHKMMREGWELLSARGGFLMSATTYTLRRPNPRYRGEAATR